MLNITVIPASETLSVRACVFSYQLEEEKQATMKRLTQLEQELEKTRQQLDETTKNSEEREKSANEV